MVRLNNVYREILLECVVYCINTVNDEVLLAYLSNKRPGVRVYFCIKLLNLNIE